MIVIHTGLPGHGKTLYTLWSVRKWAEKEGREVYYHGIPDLMIPGWIELEDPTQWHKCPPKSIVVIDEAQKVFRPRGNGAATPEHVSAAETHRHGGIDAVLITQHPMLIDGNIRRLADKHRHIIRAFGAKYATVHEWPQVMAQCEKPGARKDSVKSQFPYPKEVFTWYKSAEAHTYKASIPKKVFFGLALPFVILGLAVAAYTYMTGDMLPAVPGATQDVVDKGSEKATEGGQGGQRKGPKTMAEWLKERQPRLAGLPHTAPVYDGVTTPRRAPYPAACVASATRCVCYTQQGTRMDTDDELCRQISETGYFVAWDTSEGNRDRPLQQAQTAHVLPASEPGAPPGALGASTWGGVPASYTWGGVPPAR